MFAFNLADRLVRHDALETRAFLAGTPLILGIVYYLVARSQNDRVH